MKAGSDGSGDDDNENCDDDDEDNNGDDDNDEDDGRDNGDKDDGKDGDNKHYADRGDDDNDGGDSEGVDNSADGAGDGYSRTVKTMVTIMNGDLDENDNVDSDEGGVCGRSKKGLKAPKRSQDVSK